jgi:lysophospholipase L1-like esterase
MKGAAITIAITALCLASAEGAARLWIEKRGDALDLTRRILEVDPHLGWRQRPNLDLSFLGKPLKTEEHGWRVWPHDRRSGKSVLFLGPSSTFGWGVNGDETYAAELERNSSFAAINAGEIGFSSEQGVRLAESPEIAQLHPDTVVIAYGVNDLDRDRFFFQSEKSDSDELDHPVSPLSIALANWIDSSSAATLLYRFAGDIRGWLGLGKGSTERLVRSPDDPVPGVRVSKARFRHNLETLADAFKKQGARVVLLSTSLRLPTPEPEAAIVHVALEQARKAWAAGDSEGVRHAVSGIVFKGMGNSEAFYYLAAADRALGLLPDARTALREARNRESARISRDAALYNEELRSLAREKGLESGDLDAWLGSPGERAAMFADPVHFSVEGNKRIARGLLALLSGGST